jgi:hypothetical protein
LERQRFCLDIACELYFLKARDTFYSRNAAEPYPQLTPAKGGSRIITTGPVAGGYTLGDTLAYWKNAKLIEKFTESYGLGRLDEATEAARELQKVLSQR